MGNLLHGRARTTPEIRKAIQESNESILKLAHRYGINRLTVMKWRKRKHTSDLKSGPKKPRSTLLTEAEEICCFTFRKHTQLGLDDCLYNLKQLFPKLTRSSLHRCFKRHGVNLIPKAETQKEKTKKFKKYEPGFLHIDIAQVRTEEGILYLFVAIDRTTKYVYVELQEQQTAHVAVKFLKNTLAHFPYKIHKILTDNGLQFTHRKKIKKLHLFDQVCQEKNIEHRLTLPYHPWTNGQVERMNRTLKDRTVKKYYYKNHKTLKKHLYAFIKAYNYANPLKTLGYKTPFEYIQGYFNKKSNIFKEKHKINPAYQLAKPYK